jgi:predicted HTH domain antitoxin
MGRVKLRETVLKQYRESRITLRQGAELLGITYLEMNQLLREHYSRWHGTRGPPCAASRR